MDIVRTAEPRLEAIANSAILRVFMGVVLIVAPPMIGWGMSTILDRLNAIEASLNAGRVNSATTELRLLSLENVRANERLLKVEFEVEQLRRK